MAAAAAAQVMVAVANCIAAAIVIARVPASTCFPLPSYPQ